MVRCVRFEVASRRPMRQKHAEPSALCSSRGALMSYRDQSVH